MAKIRRFLSPITWLILLAFAFGLPFQGAQQAQGSGISAPFSGGLITSPLDMAAMSTFGVGNASQARFRYNESTNTLQVSLNGAAYVSIATGATTLGAAVNASNVVNSVAASGQFTWTTGGTYAAGATSEIYFPTDTGGFISGGTGATNGNAVTITAGIATNGNGAAVNLTGTAGTSTNGTGGGVVLTGGAGLGSGQAGGISGTAGQSVTGSAGTVDWAGGAATSGNTAGGFVRMTGGAGSGSQSGGQAIITAGAAGATGSGGNVSINSGASTAGTTGSIIFTIANFSGSGSGGNITFTGRSAGGSNNTGTTISGTCGNSFGSGVGGAFTFTCGNGGATGNGGASTLTSGDGGATSGTGGAASLVAGNGTGSSSGVGGLASLTGGNGSTGSNNNNAGGVSFSTGNSSGSGTSSMIFKVAATAGSGSTANTATTMLTLSNGGTGGYKATWAYGTITSLDNFESTTGTWNTASTFTGKLTNITATSSNAASAIEAWQIGSSDRARLYKNGCLFITDNGTIGAGTTNSNSAMLATFDATLTYRFYNAGTGNYPVFQLGTARNTTASPQTVQNGDTLGSIAYAGYVGATSTYATCATVEGYMDGVPADNSSFPGRLVFSTLPASTLSAPIKRHAMTSNGHFQSTSALFWGWCNSTTDPTGTPDTTISRNAAGVVQFGTTAANASGSFLAVTGTFSTSVVTPLVNAAAGATAITVRAGDGSASAGGAATFRAGDGAGTAAGGAGTLRGGSGAGVDQNGGGLTVISGLPTGTGSASQTFQTGYKLGTGSSAQVAYDRLFLCGKSFDSATPGTSGTVLNFCNMSNAVSNSGVGCEVAYLVEVADGSSHVSTIMGTMIVASENRGGTVLASTTTAGTGNQVIQNSATFTTLACTTTVTVTGTNVLLKVTPTWAAGTPTLVRVTYQIRGCGQASFSAQ